MWIDSTLSKLLANMHPLQVRKRKCFRQRSLLKISKCRHTLTCVIKVCHEKSYVNPIVINHFHIPARGNSEVICSDPSFHKCKESDPERISDLTKLKHPVSGRSQTRIQDVCVCAYASVCEIVSVIVCKWCGSVCMNMCVQV